MKKTEWFPADVKPVHPGRYEVQGRTGMDGFTPSFFWDAEWVPGEGWRGMDGKWLMWQNRPWRGVAQEAA